MPDMLQLVDDAESLVNYALQNKIALPAGSALTLLSARSQLATLATPGPPRDAFYAALDAAVGVIPLSASAIRASTLRRTRLAPLIEDAQSLMNFAAANAQKIDDDVRDPLIDAADAVARGTPDLASEQSFYKAYEALTAKTAPVTAETLVASTTVLPDWGKLFSRAGFWASCKDLTLGRFFDALVFAIVLLSACIALNYYSLGSTALQSYRDLTPQYTQAETDYAKDQDLRTLRQESAAKVTPAAADASDLAHKNLLDADRQVKQDEANITRIRAQQDSYADRLQRWTRMPCNYRLTAWAMCPSVGADRLASIDVAETAVTRMSAIILPLLLGWLGAQAFVLRKMASDISTHAFAKSSSIHHIVRISLGALAGVASTWLLTPALVGGDELKHLPPWALAFIAGYGIELVFAFMDRIIAAFVTKTP
jgi:hypothetical protein